MKQLLLLPLSLFFAGSAYAAYDSKVGTIEWFIQKNNTIYQQQRIGFPNNPKYNRTLGTMTKPIGSTKLPTYMPQRITQQSFARGMFNALVKRHPVAMAATTAIAALEIYECATSESGWCHMEEEQTSELQCELGETPLPNLGGCGTPAPEQSCEITGMNGRDYSQNVIYWGGEVSGYVSALSSRNTVTESGFPSCASTDTRTYTTDFNYNCSDSNGATTVNVPYTVTQTRVQNIASSNPCTHTEYTTTNTVNYLMTVTIEWSDEVQCPDSHPLGPVYYDDGERMGNFCYRIPEQEQPEPRDVTLDDLKRWIAERPNIFDDVPDDILKDPVTGKPDDTFFDNPRHTPISPPLSDAFESLGTGLAQDTNPSAPYYIPPELKPDVETARDKFHNDEPFTDPFTNTTVTPDPEPTEPNPYTPPAEVTVNLENLTVEVDVDMNWDEFPGITQDQYEESNDKMAEAYDSFETPDVESADTDFLDTLQENPELPFTPYDFGNLWPISGGQCTGFNVNVSVRGDLKTIVVDKHCPPYNEWAHPLLSWFLQLLAALHIFHLFSRMISAG